MPYSGNILPKQVIYYYEYCSIGHCIVYVAIQSALQVTYQRLEAWLSCYVECHHGNASLNQVTVTPNLIKA